MRIVVIHDLCEANAVCARRAPDVFRVDDDDQLQILVERPTAEQLARVRDAIDRCPRAALALIDD